VTARRGKRGWRPQDREEALLRAALSAPPEAAAIWRRVSMAIDVETLNPAWLDVLPLLYRKLAAAGAEDPWLGRLKGVYRRAWYANQLLLRRAGAVLEALHAGRVEGMVLGGAAVALMHYRDAGARPMSDTCIAVRPEAVGRALEVLDRAGWHAPPLSVDALLSTRLGVGLRDASGAGLELRWHALPIPSFEDDLWGAAVPLGIGDVRTQAPCSEDQLLQTCAHGIAWTPGPRSFCWLADALVILGSSGRAIEWERVVAQAIGKRVVLALRATLPYLRDTFAAPVPAGVVDSLQAASTTRSERAAFRASLRAPTPLGVTRVHRARRRAFARLEPDRRLGFGAYVQSLAGLERRAQVPLHAARRSVTLGARAIRSR
jgi:hypothetical protein